MNRIVNKIYKNIDKNIPTGYQAICLGTTVLTVGKSFHLGYKTNDPFYIYAVAPTIGIISLLAGPVVLICGVYIGLYDRVEKREFP